MRNDNNLAHWRAYNDKGMLGFAHTKGSRFVSSELTFRQFGMMTDMSKSITLEHFIEDKSEYKLTTSKDNHTKQPQRNRT